MHMIGWLDHKTFVTMISVWGRPAIDGVNMTSEGISNTHHNE